MVVIMVKHFTVRPKPIEGEALSSFLMRVCELNNIRILEIWNFVRQTKIYKVDRGVSFKFDTNPSDIVDIVKISALIGQSTEVVNQLTFESFVSTIYRGTTGKRIFGREVQTKFRRFCRSCLKEKKGYKLLWQVLEITNCEKHFTKLESKCRECGEEQPYINDHYSKKCINCNSILTEQKEEFVDDEEIIKQQIRVYRDWENILHFATVKDNFKVSPQNWQRKIAIALLFISTLNIENFSYRNHSYLSKSQVRKLVKMSKNNQQNDSIVLSFVLKVIRDFNIHFDELLKLKVPLSFHRFLLKKEKKEPEIPNCSSEWCECYGSKESMIKLDNRSPKNYIPKQHIYTEVSVCTSCWVIIGRNKNTLGWETVNIDKRLVLEIKGRLNEGISTYKTISQLLNIDYFKMRVYIGYIFRYKITTIEARKIYKELDSDQLIQCFEKLRPFWRSYQNIAKNAKALFSWRADETFYYFWHPKVQEYIYFH